jgi:hypothetical protein
MISKTAPLLKSLDNCTKLLPYRERYFINAAESDLQHLKHFPDQYYLKHTNGVILFGVTKLHEVFKKENPKVKAVNFNFQNGDKSSFVGKKKRNALMVKPGVKICDIELEDGSVYPVVCQYKGKAIDFNDEFEANPNLLIQDPLNTGYLAILM